MAKEHTERPKKTKTPTQLAKKAENEAKAAERLAKLQAVQALVKDLRTQGYQGSDATIIQQHQDALKAQEKKAKEEKQRAFQAEMQAKQNKYVEETLAGPSGKQYKEWLKDKPATFKNCETFLSSLKNKSVNTI